MSKTWECTKTFISTRPTDMNMKRYPSQGKVNSSSVACELERKPPIPRQRTSLRYANDWSSCTPSVDIYENLRLDAEYCEIDVSGENIYENICGKCGRIYSGDQCSECNREFNRAQKSSRKIVDFFGSLKRRQKSEPRRKKLEIIHNVDGFDKVFSTRDTFDLTEICQLKQEHVEHTYGRIQQTHYENVSPSCDEVRDSSLAAWMISLRWEVVDYNDNCAISVKSVPSQYQLHVSRWREFSSSEEQDFTQHILIFIESVCAKSRKRVKSEPKSVGKPKENSLEIVNVSRISPLNPFDFLNRIFLSIGINTALLDFNNELIVFCLQTQNWRQTRERVNEREGGLVMRILEKEDNLSSLNTMADSNTAPDQDTNNLNTAKKSQTITKDFNIKLSDSIYQPIWQFHTVGIGREAVAVEALECSYNSDDFVDEIDSGEWEIAEEFEFSASRECLAVEELEEESPQECSPYRTVCILFSRDQPHLNRYIHDYRRHRHIFEHPINTHQTHQSDYETVDEGISPESRNFSIPDSVMAWKFMLLNANYPEDEEDVILSPTLESLSQSISSVDLSMDSFKRAMRDAKSSVNFLRTRSKEDSEIVTGVYYKSPLGHFSNSVNNLSTLSSSDSQKSSPSTSSTYSPSETKKLPKILQPLAKTPSPTAPVRRLKKEDKPKTIFGPNLNDVRLDDDEGVPKFVVRCIRCIEMEENITTNGIYRASGNKNLIEAVRKKMNERHHIRKDLIWTFLEKQDVHTLTGSLKLFFRNLTTQLIPDNVFDRLPQPLDETCVPWIKAEVHSLPEISRKTLNFLIKHLLKVTQHSKDNFMNSSNLSICWGACIFASSQKALETFDTTDVVRKNYLIKLLIEKYDSIFDQI